MKKNDPKKKSKNTGPSVHSEQILQDNYKEEGLAFASSDGLLHYFNFHFEDLYSRLSSTPIATETHLAETLLFPSVPKGMAMMAKVLEGTTIELSAPLNRSTAGTFVSIRLEPAFHRTRIVGAFIKLSQKKITTDLPSMNFKALVEKSGDAVVLMSPEGKPIYASPSVEKVLGYTTEEVMRLDLYNVVHPDDLLENQKVMEKAILNPNLPIQGHRSRILHKDGTYHWYDAIVVNLLNDPAVGGIVDNIWEVTDRVEAGKTNRIIEEMYGMVVDNANIGVWELDLETMQMTRNLRHDEIFGYDDAEAEWSKARFIDHIHPSDRQQVQKNFAESIKTGELHFTTRIIWPDNSVHWVSVRGKMLDIAGSQKMFGTILKETEIQQTKIALAQSESRLKGIVEHLSEGLVISDHDGNLIYWNPAALKMHDMQSRQEGLKNVQEFLKRYKFYEKDDTLLPFKKWPIPRLLRNEPVKDLELQLKTLKGNWRKVFRYNGGSFEDTLGNTVYFLSIVDVTEISDNRKRIKQKEGHFWDAFHFTPIALAITRKSDGVVLDLNKGTEELLGYSYDDYMGQPILALNRASIDDYNTFLTSFINNDKQYSEHELYILTSSGERCILVFSVEQITLEDENCCLSILLDITNRKPKAGSA